MQALPVDGRARCFERTGASGTIAPSVSENVWIAGPMSVAPGGRPEAKSAPSEPYARSTAWTASVSAAASSEVNVRCLKPSRRSASAGVEGADEGGRAAVHALRQVGELGEDDGAAAPREQGGEQADDLLVGRVVEGARDRDRVVADERGALVAVGERVEDGRAVGGGERVVVDGGEVEHRVWA